VVWVVLGVSLAWELPPPPDLFVTTQAVRSRLRPSFPLRPMW
jgi:hypothetical protein